MLVAQFDALLAILEPQKKATNSSELSVHYLYGALCCETNRWTWQSPFWILAFACMVALNYQNPIQIFLWRTKVSDAVCKRDWYNLFFNVWKFWRTVEKWIMFLWNICSIWKNIKCKYILHILFMYIYIYKIYSMKFAIYIIIVCSFKCCKCFSFLNSTPLLFPSVRALTASALACLSAEQLSLRDWRLNTIHTHIHSVMLVLHLNHSPAPETMFLFQNQVHCLVIYCLHSQLPSPTAS